LARALDRVAVHHPIGLLVLLSLFGPLAVGCDAKKDEADPKVAARAKDDAKTPAPVATPAPDAKRAEPAPGAEVGGSDSGGAPAEGGGSTGGTEVPAVDAGPVINDGDLDLRAERVGDLALGMDAAAVEKLLGKPDAKTAFEEEGATGDFVQSWTYRSLELELGMAAVDGKGTDNGLSNISVGKASSLTLPWGLKIGSTRAEVEKVYGTHFDPDFTDKDKFVAGSVYGGAFYDFEDGKVVGLFLGAGAE
jgi:hypothetical protein